MMFCHNALSISGLEMRVWSHTTPYRIDRKNGLDGLQQSLKILSFNVLRVSHVKHNVIFLVECGRTLE